MRATVKATACALSCAAFFPAFATKSGSDQASRSSAQASSSLSHGIEFQSEKDRIFKDEPHLAVFTLSTSWISGEGHKGYIRYRMRAYGEGIDLKEAPAYVERLHACSFTIVLMDKESFIIRRIPIAFSLGTDSDGDVVALIANDMTQMDESDYRSFIQGQWQNSWTCAE